MSRSPREMAGAANSKPLNFWSRIRRKKRARQAKECPGLKGRGILIISMQALDCFCTPKAADAKDIYRDETYLNDRPFGNPSIYSIPGTEECVAKIVNGSRIARQLVHKYGEL